MRNWRIGLVVLSISIIFAFLTAPIVFGDAVEFKEEDPKQLFPDYLLEDKPLPPLPGTPEYFEAMKKVYMEWNYVFEERVQTLNDAWAEYEAAIQDKDSQKISNEAAYERVNNVYKIFGDLTKALFYVPVPPVLPKLEQVKLLEEASSSLFAAAFLGKEAVGGALRLIKTSADAKKWSAVEKRIAEAKGSLKKAVAAQEAVKLQLMPVE